MVSDMHNYNVTALSARVLAQIFRGRVLESVLDRYRDTPVKAQLSHVCYQSTRHYYSLTERLQLVLDRPKEKLDLEVLCVLVAAACQIEHTKTPRHTVVSVAVDATRKIGKSSASSLVNAVLRKYDPESKLQTEESKFESPGWMLDKIGQHYPSEKTEVLSALTARAPLTLRINSHNITRQNYCALLDEADIGYTLPPVDHAIVLSKPQSMTTLPGYKQNLIQVQDLSSQLAVPLLSPEREHRVLDGCCAPGIKTLQILDLFPHSHVCSVDVKPKCSTWNIVQNDQLNRNHEVLQGDLKATQWWNGTPFQKVLLDVPCSGTGTWRRHPDSKLTLSPAKIDELVALQLQILMSSWETLEKGGDLVYVTCSILPEENDAVVEQLLQSDSRAGINSFQLPYGNATKWGWQILPTKNGGDGFYFARLRKTESH